MLRACFRKIMYNYYMADMKKKAEEDMNNLRNAVITRISEGVKP